MDAVEPIGIVVGAIHRQDRARLQGNPVQRQYVVNLGRGQGSAKVHDVLALHWIPLEPRSILTMDRACNDSDRLYRIHRIPAFFVVRPKKNLRYCRR